MMIESCRHDRKVYECRVESVHHTNLINILNIRSGGNGLSVVLFVFGVYVPRVKLQGI